MRWPWVSRRAHEARVAALEAELRAMEADALEALAEAEMSVDPHGWGWSERAAEIWSEVRSR